MMSQVEKITLMKWPVGCCDDKHLSNAAAIDALSERLDKLERPAGGDVGLNSDFPAASKDTPPAEPISDNWARYSTSWRTNVGEPPTDTLETTLRRRIDELESQLAECKQAAECFRLIETTPLEIYYHGIHKKWAARSMIYDQRNTNWYDTLAEAIRKAAGEEK
jgi:hypothetical protein